MENPWKIHNTLWLFNIAMENGPFIDGLPIKNGDFSVAMLVYQRVTFPWLFPWHPGTVFSRPGGPFPPRGPGEPDVAGACGRSTAAGLQLRGPAALMWLGHGGRLHHGLGMLKWIEKNWNSRWFKMISPAKSGNFSHEHVWMCSEFTEWTEKSRFKARCGVEDRQSIGFSRKVA